MLDESLDPLQLVQQIESRYRDLWRELTEMAGDSAFGIKVAQEMPEGTTGVAEYAARNATTLRGALQSVVRYSRLLNDAARIELTEVGLTGRISYRVVDDPLPPRALCDWVLAHITHGACTITQQSIVPVSVAFQHGPPTDPRPYARFFQCPLKWNQPLNELCFTRQQLDQKVPKADPHLAELMRHYADQQLARLPKTDDFLQQVRGAVAELLVHGAPRLDDVARLLGLSSRSLQRKLRDEGTSFQGFANEVRTDLAASYLAEGKLAIAEVAFLVGFSEPSAFHRAFKKARGMTPSAFREQAA